MNLSISKSGAYLRGLLLVTQAAAMPLLTKAASGGEITRADVVPAVITGVVTAQAYLNQKHATSDRDRTITVWLTGVTYVVLAILGSLEKKIVGGLPITKADAIAALLSGMMALLAYMNKSLSIAKAQDEWDKQASLSEPKPSLAQQATDILRGKAEDFLAATGSKSGGTSNG